MSSVLEAGSVSRYRLSHPATGVGNAGYFLWQGETNSGRIVEKRRGYEVDGNTFSQVFLSCLPPELADLIDVALAVYTIDRLSPRHSARYQRQGRGWQRVLEVHVPVRDPGRWERNGVQASLERLLSLFTDDVWAFRFSQRQGTGRISESQRALMHLPFDHSPAICLFSGGLDSLTGATGQLLNDPDCHLVCVAGTTSNWLGSVQMNLAMRLAKRFGQRVTLLSIPFRLSSPDGVVWQEETSQRSRGFVHLMFGAVAAVLAGLGHFSVHENGIGAINLPYTGAQFGSHMTRAMHPLVLADAAGWLSTYLNHPFRIVGTALGLTKAQANRVLMQTGLEHLASLSFSCDGFQRIAGQPQCGVCTSCLLRRQSLHTSGMAKFDDPRGYRFDITDPNSSIPDQHLAGLRLMEDQLSVMGQCLAANDPWRAMVSTFPALAELEARTMDWLSVGGPDLPKVALLEMYHVYTSEWEQFRRNLVLGDGSSMVTAA